MSDLEKILHIFNEENINPIVLKMAEIRESYKVDNKKPKNNYQVDDAIANYYRHFYGKLKGSQMEINYAYTVYKKNIVGKLIPEDEFNYLSKMALEGPEGCLKVLIDNVHKTLV